MSDDGTRATRVEEPDGSARRRTPAPAANDLPLPAPVAVAPDTTLAALPGGRGSALLQQQLVGQMQQVQGNRFVQRLLARDRAIQRVPEQGGSTTAATAPPIDQAALAQAPNWQAQHAAYENVNLLPVIYTHRDEMLRRFLELYRRLDAQDLSRTPEAEREAPLTTVRQEIQAEITRLGGLQAGGDANAQSQIETLRALLERGQGTGREALEMARTWARRPVAELQGPALLAQVRAQFGLSNVPAWARPIVLEYGGMRYRSGHGTWVPPQELLWQIVVNTPSAERPAGWADSRAGRQMHREIQGLANEQALGRIQAMRTAGQIPDGPWHRIVRLTDLRRDTEDPNWESSQGEQIVAPWDRILRQWTAGQTTSWRAELMRRNALVTTQVVCNELAEAVARSRGIRLPGGITANVAYFQRQAAQAAQQAGASPQQAEAAAQANQQGGAQPGPQPGPQPGLQAEAAQGTGAGTGTAQALGPAQAAPAPAPFFVHGPRATADHLRPGAALFFLAGSSRTNGWTANPQPHDRVTIVSGVQYPVPCDTGGGACGEGTAITDGLEQGGWTFHVTADQIYRSRTTTIPQAPPRRRGAAPEPAPEPQPLPAGEEIRHYMRWSHQATILRVSGNTVVTIETTDLGAGVSERTVNSLHSPFVFISWAPGT